MFNDDDFMGGIFDFDGNGKTTLDEQYVAYKIYEETTKEENNSKPSYHKPEKYNYANNSPTNSKGTKTGNMIAIVAVIISLLLLFAKCSSNSPKNNSYKSSSRKSYSYSSSTSYPSRTSSTSTTSKPYSSSSSYSSYSSSSKSKSYSSRSKSGSKSKDEYNAKDYYHAEDFYEDHYDDFYDYEDAEDYFNDHHDD